uniref:Uncharacterized protein n=1 Tax=Solanum tuberosum TaxID=4113 RepID=M1DW83_SOLTU
MCSYERNGAVRRTAEQFGGICSPRLSAQHVHYHPSLSNLTQQPQIISRPFSDVSQGRPFIRQIAKCLVSLPNVTGSASPVKIPMVVYIAFADMVGDAPLASLDYRGVQGLS